MTGRRILAAIFLLPALGAGYMAWITWRAGDDGKWLFAVFAAFFFLLTLAPLVPEFRKKAPPPEPTSTRFGPHWFMLLAILVLLGTAVMALIDAILRH